MSDISSIISRIQELPHYFKFKCRACAAEVRVYALQIHANCPQCGLKHRCRAYVEVDEEIQDVIDAVLVWAGKGASFAAFIQRREEILAGEKKEGKGSRAE